MQDLKMIRDFITLEKTFWIPFHVQENTTRSRIRHFITLCKTFV